MFVSRVKGRRVTSGGQIDMLLIDDEEDIRYEVELQLGATDPSHIIRTIEYWDLEKRQYPDSRHAAVIVAEDITARFFNVINLFGGAIPIIAIKVCAFELDAENVMLLFVTVIDHRVSDAAEDEPTIEKDREYWATKSKPEFLNLMDDMLELVRQTDSNINLNYNQHYVGLISDHRPTTCVLFRPKQTQLNLEIKLPREDSYDAMLDDSDIVQNRYSIKHNRYRLVIQPGISESDCKVLQHLFGGRLSAI